MLFIVGQWTLNHSASSTNNASIGGLIPIRSPCFLTARQNTLVERFMIKDVQMMHWRMEHISIHGSAFYATALHKSATFVSNFSDARNNPF
ncbi:predicted protein [Botrytis cinerea T4]|uniref:Uncharacterized protein n=1 Tax=Botryotinia fuckeliana (strain T4) TaxID=999810 RepID=G2YKR2_BOTF4|nr:predicted protein [Botrytis cinerea T4]